LATVPASPQEPLEDRADAGRRLAARLERYRRDAPIVLAIPRGGVPVGAEIARALSCPLDVLVVRKVATNQDPEYGLGAVAEGDLTVLDERRVRAAGLTPEALEPIVRRERGAVRLRAARFRAGAPAVSWEGRTAIVVDDGVATGGTLAAGIAVVRARAPRAVIAAVGVAPAEAIVALRRSVEEVVVALIPPYLDAVGQWYRQFEPVDDATVVRLLREARPAAPDPSR
jgi:putative phosphoribosyl transferase